MSEAYERVVHALGVATFAVEADDALQPLQPCPDWARRLVLAEDLADAAPLLDDFLVEARTFWARGDAGRIRSDTWVQSLAGESEPVYLTALATSDGEGTQTLLLRRLADFEEERQIPLQAARDALLDRQRLLKEIESKEILLHCIVHDLKGPLAGMLGSFSLLKGAQARPLEAERLAELVELGDEQARKQQAMIESLLAVFAAEVEELEAFETTPERAPDLARAAADVARGLGPAFERKRVTLTLDVPEAAASWRVHGRRLVLERVIMNLVENALRHAPGASEVRLRLTELDGRRRLSVEDEGPGVPEERRAEVFEKFVQGGRGGVAGLGLYFARITVERWGGTIGCGNPPQSAPVATGEGLPGACFWFELPGA